MMKKAEGTKLLSIIGDEVFDFSVFVINGILGHGDRIFVGWDRREKCERRY